MKPEPVIRPSELVLSAIYNLDEANGSSSEEIVEYISAKYGIKSDDIKKKVEAALKCGHSFGLISRGATGLYKIRDITEGQHLSQSRRTGQRRKRSSIHTRRGNIEQGEVENDEVKGSGEGVSNPKRNRRQNVGGGESSGNQRGQVG